MWYRKVLIETNKEIYLNTFLVEGNLPDMHCAQYHKMAIGDGNHEFASLRETTDCYVTTPLSCTSIYDIILIRWDIRECT